MKIFTYIQYFFFLAFNWNWKIAFHIISHEIRGEKKYNIDTTGSDELKKTKASGVDTSHATLYMPANYELLEQVFSMLPPFSKQHFIDIGCGKGRAVCIAAHSGFQKVTGVDFSKQLCDLAEKNLQHTKEIFPGFSFSVIIQDATSFAIPEDADCIYFFNPFDQFVMNAVATNIRNSYKNNPRDIYVIYLNPLYKKELLDIGFKEIYHTIKMKYMEAVILHKAMQ